MKGVFTNYDSSTHDADLVIVNCPSALYPDSEDPVRPPDYAPALGAIYVASAAASRSILGVPGEFRVKYIDGECGLGLNQLVLETMQASPRWVGLCFTHRVVGIATELVGRLRLAGVNARLLLGGAGAMLHPRRALANFPDAVCCIGEGERVVRELLDGRPVACIAGTANLSEGVYTEREGEQLRIGSDEDVQVLYRKFGGIFVNRAQVPEAVMLSSRGCQWKCAFCSTPNSMGMVRYRAMERVVADIKHLVQEGGVQSIHFFDDVFLAGERRMQSFVSSLRACSLEGAVTFKVLARADVLSRTSVSMLAELRSCGIRRIGIGIESGSDEMLRQIKRGITRAMVLEALERCRSAGIGTRGYFMFGMPNETVHHMQQTFEFAAELLSRGLLVDGYAHFAKAYPGTEWEAEAERTGRVEALSDRYIPVKSADGNEILRNSAVPRIPLCDVPKEVILDFVYRANRLLNPASNERQGR